MPDELLNRIRSGDENAWTKLVMERWPKLVYWARKHLGNEDDTEDIAQDVLLRLYTAIKTGRVTHFDELDSWLKRGVAFKCNDVLRKKYGRKPDRGCEIVGIESFEIVDESEGPQQVVEQRQQDQLIREELNALPDEFLSRIIHDRIYEGKTFDAIAREHGITPAKARGAFQKALKILRKELAPYCRAGD